MITVSGILRSEPIAQEKIETHKRKWKDYYFLIK